MWVENDDDDREDIKEGGTRLVRIVSKYGPCPITEMSSACVEKTEEVKRCADPFIAFFFLEFDETS